MKTYEDIFLGIMGRTITEDLLNNLATQLELASGNPAQVFQPFDNGIVEAQITDANGYHTALLCNEGIAHVHGHIEVNVMVKWLNVR